MWLSESLFHRHTGLWWDGPKIKASDIEWLGSLWVKIHRLLQGLAWAVSWHTGTPGSIPSFWNTGEAVELTHGTAGNIVYSDWTKWTTSAPRVGTKLVDESQIWDMKILQYFASSDTLKYVSIQAIIAMIFISGAIDTPIIQGSVVPPFSFISWQPI